MATFIIGDVHGCLHSLTALLEKIYSVHPKSQLIFVGDICDRGKWTKHTVDLILSLENAICLRGNHDDVFDYLINDHSLSHPSEWVTLPPTKEKIIRWWLPYGLYETLQSYNINRPYLVPGMYGKVIYTERILEELQEKVPESHKQFFNKLPLFWENDTHFACHAFFDPFSELPRMMKFVKSDKRDETLWGRFENLFNIKTKWDRIGIFGHTPTPVLKKYEPIATEKIRLIDCGCSMGNKLAAYHVEMDSFLWVDADKRDFSLEE